MKIIKAINRFLHPFNIKKVLQEGSIILGAPKMPRYERELRDKWAEKIIELHFESHPEELDRLRKASIRR